MVRFSIYMMLIARNKASRSLELYQVLRVLLIKKKLISISKLTNENDVYVEFHDECCLMKGQENISSSSSSFDIQPHFDSCAVIRSSSRTNHKWFQVLIQKRHQQYIFYFKIFYRQTKFHVYFYRVLCPY